MTKIVYDNTCEEEIDNLLPSLNKLHNKVIKDLGHLEDFGGETLIRGSNLPPDTRSLIQGKYSGKIKYVRTKQSSDIFRVYFFRAGKYIICLKGWQKKQDDIPPRILNQIEQRYEYWIDYIRS
jgi:hypothetical protein